jgi:hypothetical protein
MERRSYSDKCIRPEMTVRQVAADFPGSPEVFRRYGEDDPPAGRFGHFEPLDKFARRRGLRLDALLNELTAATGAPVDRSGPFAQRIHHRFIVSALALTLTLGAGWGAWLLWRIGWWADFDAASAAQVIAHGEAQLWGFVVLFVVGVSLRTVLLDAVRRPWGTWVSNALLALALVGICGGLAWSLAPGRLPWAGSLGAAALCAFSVGLSALQWKILATKWRVVSSQAVLASGLWLTAWALLTLWLRSHAGERGPSAYTDAQRMLLIQFGVFGFAMNSIYGFGQMLLPGLLRLGKVSNRATTGAIAMHNAATLLLCLATAKMAGTLATVAGAMLLVAAAATFAIAHRGFVGRVRTSYRDEQGHAPLDWYPPLAFGWLGVSLLLLSGGVIFELATKRALPHAYTGAVRHALTVGFMTTLILGVGQRLIPVFDRTVLAMPRLAAPTLILIAAGNLLRVSSELAALVTSAAFVVMPISGVMEWCALALFTISMLATMYHTDTLMKRGRVTQRSSLAVLLAEHPWIEDRLRSGGTGYLERARSVPNELTISSFAASERYEPAKLVAQLNEWLAAWEQASAAVPPRLTPASAPTEFGEISS